MKSGIEFLDRINNNVIANFRKGSAILIHSRSKFSVPVLVHRYIIVSASSCGVTGMGAKARSGTGLAKRTPTAGSHHRCRSRRSGHPVAFIPGPRRHHRNRGLGMFLTCIPIGPGRVDAATFRTCLIGSDGCCLRFLCVDTRNTK